MKKVNFHTHTKRCNHAYGEDEEYVLNAIKGGFEVLGFSDHAPWPYDSDYKSPMRMDFEGFKDYYQSILSLKEKYKSQIDIKIGLEVEYYPKYIESMKEFIKDNDLDYVIFGNHFMESDEYRNHYYGSICKDNRNLLSYVEDVKRGLKEGIYSYLAHPDLFMRSRTSFDDICEKASYEICKYAKENDVILEFNLEGLRLGSAYGEVGYPCSNFWMIAKEIGNKVIIGVDAHNPSSLSSEYYDLAYDFLSKNGFEIVDTIKYFK